MCQWLTGCATTTRQTLFHARLSACGELQACRVTARPTGKVARTPAARSEISRKARASLYFLPFHLSTALPCAGPPPLDSIHLTTTAQIGENTSTMSEEPRKRSRFDQAPSEEPPRKSRFDRRSRSPSTKDPEASARERSPVKSVESPAAGEKKDEAKDPAAIAAAAAARISASLQKSKGIQQVEVPPIRKVRTTMAVFICQLRRRARILWLPESICAM